MLILLTPLTKHILLIIALLAFYCAVCFIGWAIVRVNRKPTIRPKLLHGHCFEIHQQKENGEWERMPYTCKADFSGPGVKDNHVNILITRNIAAKCLSGSAQNENIFDAPEFTAPPTYSNAERTD